MAAAGKFGQRSDTSPQSTFAFMLQRLLKPWFIRRPQQIVLRAIRSLRPVPPGFRKIHTAWHADIIADATKAIGHSIWTTGVYDLTVSEVLARLIRPGDRVVDAGANIGYMTVLAARAAGPQGSVTAFEPHPELFGVLRSNAEEAAKGSSAAITLRNVALGETSGRATLVIPDAMSANDGVAHLGTATNAGVRVIEVELVTLDDELGGESVGVMKIDVEGFETAVLKGSRRALTEHRIREIVFEDHEGPASETCRLLESFGYKIFSTGWTLRGLTLQPASEGRAAADYEAPSFVATLQPNETLERCRASGFRVLKPL
jgi:FkbM family methyltransferase